LRTRRSFRESRRPRGGAWSRARLCAGVAVAGLAAAGCGLRPPALEGAPPARLEKITEVYAPAPGRDGRLPGIVGRLQRRRVAPGETLLDIAREAGLGFAELRDANPAIDEWVPPPGAEVLVPTRWILPRARARGLVVNIPEMRLYLFPADARPGELVPIHTWAVGIGIERAPSPVGPVTVRAKDERPTWVVPDSILRTMERPRRVVPPGPDNPLGSHRIRLSRGLYAVHGTNAPWSIGRLTTRGCIRLYPEDIEDLYPRVRPGTPGELVYQPVKLGASRDRVYVEVHRDVYGRIPDLERHAFAEVRRLGLGGRVDPERLRAAVRERSGVPVDVTGAGEARAGAPPARDRPDAAARRDRAPGAPPARDRTPDAAARARR
jgi:L,D-transpeptidase ErfK/SrfK